MSLAVVLFVACECDINIWSFFEGASLGQTWGMMPMDITATKNPFGTLGKCGTDGTGGALQFAAPGTGDRVDDAIDCNQRVADGYEILI